MAINTSFPNIPDLRLRNFVIDQIKKHLNQCNFSEIDITEKAKDQYKVFSHRIDANANQININILKSCTTQSFNETNVFQSAYLIKILDTIFLETFKLESYALKLNSLDHNDNFAKLTRLLQVLSVSYVIDTNLRTYNSQNKVAFEFVSRQAQNGPTEPHASDSFTLGGSYCITKSNNAPVLINTCAEINILQLTTLVKKYQNRLLIPERPALHVIIPVNKEQNALALLLDDYLRSNYLSTDLIMENTSIADTMQKATKLGAKYILIIGTEEQNNGTVIIRNAQKNESLSVKQAEIISYLK